MEQDVRNLATMIAFTMQGNAAAIANKHGISVEKATAELCCSVILQAVSGIAWAANSDADPVDLSNRLMGIIAKEVGADHPCKPVSNTNPSRN